MNAPVLEIASLTKHYGALRPLRLQSLVVRAGEQVSLVGPDQPAAEVLINLVTGASLPDSGEVRVFGRSTAEVSSSDEWLAGLDRFGIVSERAALLDALTLIQNLAVPFSLDIEPPPDPVRQQAEALAGELRLPAALLDVRVGDLNSSVRLRLRTARALALGPTLVLFEHPSAGLPRGDIGEVARDIHDALARRGAAAIAITADRDYARAASHRAAALDPATGKLKPL